MPVAGAAGYRVHWRGTTEPQWSQSRDVAETSATLQGVVLDDWFFGVSSVAADGAQSPVVFPGPAGSFVSPPPPPKQP